MKTFGEQYGLLIPLVSREEWGAVKPKKRLDLNPPIKYVRLSLTNTPNQDNTQDVVYQVWKLQQHYLHQKRPDVPWNFMIGPDGFVYKGRGWYVLPYSPKEYKWMRGQAAEIALIGRYPNDEPPWVMMKAAFDLIQYAVLMKIIAPNFEIIPFKDVNKVKEEWLDWMIPSSKLLEKLAKK